MPAPLNQPDIVIFHSTYIPVHALFAVRAQRAGIPYIITPRGGMTRGAQQMKRLKKLIGNRVFFNWMVRCAAALHCLTDQEAAETRGWNRPVFVVGNGVDLPPPEMMSNTGQKDKLRVVFIGRLDLHHKGLDLLVSGCTSIQQELRQTGAEVHLYGPDINGSRAALARMIEHDGIADIVHVEEPVFGKMKGDVLRSADLFLHTSRFEGHPTSVLEALSFAVPCLLTPGTNMADEVEKAGAGWKIRPTPDGIAEGLSTALAARAELTARGLAARALVEHEYSWKQIANKTLDQYLHIISSS